MHKLKRTGIIVVALLGLIVGSGLALAEEHDGAEPPEDTVFNFGYDPVTQVFEWDTSALEGSSVVAASLVPDGSSVVAGPNG